MNDDLIFQEYSTNRALQATYPTYESYRDFVLSQQPQQADSNSVGIAPLNNATGSIKSLGKNLIMNKLGGGNPLTMAGGLMLSGLSGINDRLRQTDFAQAKTLADYMDMQKYGGLEGRNTARRMNQREINEIQGTLDRRQAAGVYNTNDDRGMGQMPASNSSQAVGITASNQANIDPAGAAGKGRKG